MQYLHCDVRSSKTDWNGNRSRTGRFVFFFYLGLQPIRIISLISSRVHRKVGQKLEIPEKNKSHVRGSNPHLWDDQQLWALKISGNHAATGAACFESYRVGNPKDRVFLWRGSIIVVISLNFSTFDYCLVKESLKILKITHIYEDPIRTDGLVLEHPYMYRERKSCNKFG